MAKIFKKLFVGDTVATSGGKCFKKLTTEEPLPPLPVWNGTDLTGTTWEVPKTWKATAGYGKFKLKGTYNTGTNTTELSKSYSTQNFLIGYSDLQTTQTDRLCFAYDSGVLTMARSSFSLNITGGTDATNAKLITWLKENGTLTSHTMT